MAIGVRTLRMSIDGVIATKCNVNQSALVGIHGRKRNTLMSADVGLTAAVELCKKRKS